MLAGSLADLARQPALLLITIFAATFILEDAAIVAAALLAARMAVDPFAAVTVLVVGTIAGDMALYGAGRWAGKHRWVRRQRARPAVDGALQWLGRRWWMALAMARFTPGLRLPVYLSSGLLRLPPLACAAIVAVASLVWTPGIFFLAKAGGEAIGEVSLHAFTALVALLLATAALAWCRARFAGARPPGDIPVAEPSLSWRCCQSNANRSPERLRPRLASSGPIDSFG